MKRQAAKGRFFVTVMNSRDTKDKIITTAKKLIEYRSVCSNTAGQKACLDYIAGEFGQTLSVRTYELNGCPALVMTNSTNNKNDIIISGHIDVVGGRDEMFSPKIEGNRLTGRGAYDMKGPLAATLHAINDAVKHGLQKTVAIMLTSDEEISGDGTRLLLSGEKYTASEAIIPDGGDQKNLVIAQKGFAQFALTLTGMSAHASRPWQGKNPIIRVAELVQKIKERYPNPSDEYDWKTTVVPTKIEVGHALNQIPELATMFVDMRYIDQSHVSDFRKWFTNEYGSSGSMKTVAENGMFAVEETDGLVQKLSRVVQKNTSVAPGYLRECGTSDAIFFTEHGIPAVLYRPNGGGEHSDNEWVDTDSLQTLYDILRDYLLDSSG